MHGARTLPVKVVDDRYMISCGITYLSSRACTNLLILAERERERESKREK